MKKVILLICILMSVTTTMTAKKRYIYFSHKWIGKAKHSKAILPIVSYDGNIVYVESKKCIPCLTISVKSVETENVVFEEEIFCNGETPLFTNLCNGEYEIEMTIGDNVFVGHFAICETSEIDEE